MAGSPDTLLFHTHALTALPFRVTNIHAYCALLKSVRENGALEAGLWLLRVLVRDIDPRDDLQEDDRKLIRRALEDYNQERPDLVEQCLFVSRQSALGQGLQVLLSRKALERCSSAVNSFPRDRTQTRRSGPNSSAATSATLFDTLQLVEKGNLKWYRKDYAAAIAKWREALSGFVLLPVLLNNLTQVFVKLQAEGSILPTALAALALQPSNAKACARAATVPLHAAWLQAAADCAAQGLRHSPAHPDLLRIQKQPSAALVRRDVFTAGASKTPPAAPQSVKGRVMHDRAHFCQRLERVMHELKAPDIERPDPCTMMQRLALEQLAQQKPQKLRGIERLVGPIPDDFCKSFLGVQVLPAGCTGATVSDVLSEGASWAFHPWQTLFHASPSVRSMLSHGAGSQHSNPGYLRQPDPVQFAGEGVRRPGETSPERLRWFKDAPIGAVNFVKRLTYPENGLASFSNVAQHPLAIAAAGTHVDVGFVDLGVLAATVQLHQTVSAQSDPESALEA